MDLGGQYAFTVILKKRVTCGGEENLRYEQVAGLRDNWLEVAQRRSAVVSLYLHIFRPKKRDWTNV